jgi:hypothetical protein
MPTDSSEYYQVSFPGPVLHQVKLWAEQAKSHGIATSFAAQLRRVIERLSIAVAERRL